MQLTIHAEFVHEGHTVQPGTYRCWTRSDGKTVLCARGTTLAGVSRDLLVPVELIVNLVLVSA